MSWQWDAIAGQELFGHLISSEVFQILVAHLVHTLFDSARLEKPSSVTRSARRHLSTPARLHLEISN